MQDAEYALYEAPLSWCLLYLEAYYEREEKHYEQLCQTWEIIGLVHGIDIKIPFLKERREALQLQQQQEKPLPLHLQFMKAGIRVTEK